MGNDSIGNESIGEKPRTIEVVPSGESMKDEQLTLQPTLISLDGVKGVFETEAESHILQAIEEATNEREDDDESAVDSKPSILSGVPSHAAYLFNAKPDSEISKVPLIPFKPSTTAKPSLKDAANRVRMMEMASKMRTERKLNDEESVIGDKVDPESLVVDEIGNNNIPTSSSGRETSRALTFYRNRCGPCYTFTSFLKVRWGDIKYLFKMFLYLMAPCLGIAAVLFYLAGNPQGAYNSSISWWFIYVVRLSITLLLAQLSQFLLIDFICLETRLAVMAVGRMLTLMAVQAKGWPLICVLWVSWNLAILYGARQSHWLSMQDFFKIFNEKNNGGDFLSSEAYRRVLGAAFVVGGVVMIKRIIIALITGKRTYVSFGASMERMMQKVLLIGEVAMLAEETEFAVQHGDASHAAPARHRGDQSNWLFNKFTSKSDDVAEGDDVDVVEEGMRQDDELYELEGMDASVSSNINKDNPQAKQPFAWMRLNKTKKNFLMKDSDKEIIASLLGEWEEPELLKKSSLKDVSVRKILQFREALEYLDGTYPLSIPFGIADTRKHCMESAQKIYRRLLMRTPENQILHFDTLMALAIDKHGELNKEKARALIRIFRPDRKGNITLLDFVKSCDVMYKKVMIFRVATYNAVQLDTAVETIFNFIFYLFLGLIITASFAKIDPFALFSSLLALFLPLSFLFSAAASKYFEGLLLVLLRQPYNIGDRIAVSNPMIDTAPDGSTTWFVEGITLFYTTVRCAGTNEVGTYNNGSLASLRIINAARSPKAVVTIKLKFGLDVPYEKVKIFGSVIENFVKERPREWIKLLGFRATVVEADLGYIGYVVILNHVESWQNIGAIKQSLADCASFCLEVSKKLEMRFVAPPMPVDLRFGKNNAVETFPQLAVGEGSNGSESSDFNIDHNGIQMIQKLFKAQAKPATATKKKN